MKRLFALLLLFWAAPAVAQMHDMMEMDDMVFAHAMLNQFETRLADGKSSLRYDGFGWIGGDIDKLWIESEGYASETSHEILFDHAISTRLDLQAGLRADVDHGRARYWGAFGVQGLMAYIFDTEATAYIGSDGRLGARLKASTDFLLTQRLILQPEAEITRFERTEIDAGLRLRYEIARKFAPYAGIAYQNMDGNGWRLALGLRAWI